MSKSIGLDVRVNTTWTRDRFMDHKRGDLGLFTTDVFEGKDVLYSTECLCFVLIKNYSGHQYEYGVCREHEGGDGFL